MKLTRRRLTTRSKLIVLPAAAVLTGLAVAVPAGLAHGGSAGGSTARSHGRYDSSLSAAAASAPASAHGCRVTYVETDWTGQFSAQVTIANTGRAPVDGWTLTFAFPGDQAVSSAWTATFDQKGPTVSATNQGYYDASIEPGASRSLGFLGAWKSDSTAPTDFRVNGVHCS